ncbi:MAG: DUF1499 domain-containing protein [Planctomycetota bacterium]
MSPSPNTVDRSTDQPAVDGGTSTGATRGWRRLAMVGVAAPIIGLTLLVAGSLWQVEDWGRDLTTNSAATDRQHVEPRMRPVFTNLSQLQVADAVKQVAPRLPGWQLVIVGPSSSESIIDASGFTAHLVRTTPLFGFQDDVYLTITRQNGMTEVSARSRSRVGVGDLGQNPRNIREILGALRDHLINARLENAP